HDSESCARRDGQHRLQPQRRSHREGPDGGAGARWRADPRGGHAMMRLDTIRSRLSIGLALVIGLVVIAGAVGRAAIGSLSDEMGRALETVRRETALTATLTTNIATEIGAGRRYLERGSREDLATFRDAGWRAHAAQRALNASQGLSAREVALVASIDEQLSAMETAFTAAHRMKDLGRVADA